MRGVSMTVGAGEVVALLGANGAGKTTTLRAISGVVKPEAGRVSLNGEDLTRVSPSARAQRIAHVPEGRGIFFGLTVGEHFRLGHRGSGWTRASRTTTSPSSRSSTTGVRACSQAGSSRCSPSGERSPATLACCLLDELSLGLAPVIVESLLPIVRDYASNSDCAVLLVEQHVQLALEVADRGYVLSHGEIILEGSAAELRRDRHLLVASYLGEHSAVR